MDMLGHHFIQMKRNMNWPTLPNPLKRRNTKNSEDHDKDSTGSGPDKTPTSPGFKTLESPQRSLDWPSSSGPNTTPESPPGRSLESAASPQTSSTSSPQSFTSRQTSRISSFIRSRHTQPSSTTIPNPDSQDTPLPMNPETPPVHAVSRQQQEQEYNAFSQPGRSTHTSSPPITSHNQLGRMDSSPNITPLSSSSTWPGSDRSMAMLFSPVSPPTATEHVSREYGKDDHLAMGDAQNFVQNIQSTNNRTSVPYTSTPTRSSSLPHPYSGSATMKTLTEVSISKADFEQEPEVDFESPSDFALFAEATSSLSFFPTDKFSTLEPELPPVLSSSAAPAPFPITRGLSDNYESQTPPTLQPAPSNPSMNLHYSNTFPAIFKKEELEPPRSRSVPPPAFQSVHRRSTSNTVPLPTVSRQSISQTTLISQPQPPQQPQPPVSRERLIAEALTGLGDEDAIHSQEEDEELPDYETSQAEASDRQRFEAVSRARQLEEGWLRGRAERIKKPWRAWDRGQGM